MANLSFPLTDKNVFKLPCTPGLQYKARDTELKGFFVLIGARSKVFFVRATCG